MPYRRSEHSCHPPTDTSSRVDPRRPAGAGVPTIGGDTLWSDMYAAYEGLADDV